MYKEEAITIFGSGNSKDGKKLPQSNDRQQPNAEGNMKSNSEVLEVPSDISECASLFQKSSLTAATQ
jgi:hypothetical protein